MILFYNGKLRQRNKERRFERKKEGRKQKKQKRKNNIAGKFIGTKKYGNDASFSPCFIEK